MSREVNRLKDARIASPCPANWESMSGDESVRFCHECQLHVYNISEMTVEQAEELLARTEGRICARLFRRADGTILTRDCPVGLRAIRRRLAKVAGAAFTALLSLTASVTGQTLTRASKRGTVNPMMLNRSFLGLTPQEGRATIRGIITDTEKMVIPNAEATIINEKTKYKRIIKADDEGEFKFGLLEPGVYTLRIEVPGFQPFMREHLQLSSNEMLRLDVALDPAAFMGVVVCEEPPIKGIVIDGVRVKINED